MNVAAFDVDGTLTTRDCVVPFLRRVAGGRRLVAALAGQLHRSLPALARRDRDRLKELATAAVFTGRPLAEVEAAAAGFAAEVASSWLRPDVVGMLDRHRFAGDAVVLVSASYGVYLRPLGADLGVDGVLGTELEVGADGTCTGRLDGGNCRGAVKVTRLHRWLDAGRGGRGAVTLWAYGDSRGDEELLADADHPCWVGRGVSTWGRGAP
jgi:phosphatidylglycerophosphatase C